MISLIYFISRCLVFAATSCNVQNTSELYIKKTNIEIIFKSKMKINKALNLPSNWRHLLCKSAAKFFTLPGKTIAHRRHLDTNHSVINR